VRQKPHAKDDAGEIRGFVLEKGWKGLSAPAIHGKVGLRTSITGEIVLDDVFCPEENAFSEIRGLKGPFTCLNSARYGIAWGALGAAEDCYLPARQYVIDRKQFGRPVAAEGLEAVRPKMAASPAFEGESEAVGVAVRDRKAATRRQWNEFQRDAGPSLAPQPGEHPDNDVERIRATVNRHGVGALPQPQGRKAPGNAEHVVEMTLGQQEPVEPSKAGAAAQQLALCSFSAQNALASGLDQDARVIAVG
jgi:hypothetical protein